MSYEEFNPVNPGSINVPANNYDPSAQNPQKNYQGGGNYGGGNGGGYGNNNGNYGRQQGNYGGGGNGGGGGFRAGGGGNRFQRKPEEVTDKFYKPYAVMSNDQAPEHIIRQLQQAIDRLSAKGFTCRTNCSKGLAIVADQMASKKEQIIPWKGFENRESKFSWTSETALATTAKLHPTWDGLSDAVKKIVASGARLVCGDKMVSPALFLICWSQDGAEHISQRSQGTGNVVVPLAAASELGIQVFNLGKEGSFERLMRHIGE